MALVPIGPDPLEKALEEKELEVKKFIQDNYSKIRNVEKELSDLTLQVKLTAGSKKAAVELLRKKIELSGERIRRAELKEQQARKTWEDAQSVLKAEEDEKQRLCDEFTCLVQENASFQYSRLEELKKKLDALAPPVASPVHQEQERPQQHAPHLPDASSDAHADTNRQENQGFKGRGRGYKGRAKASLLLNASSTSPGWTGAGFSVENTE